MKHEQLKGEGRSLLAEIETELRECDAAEDKIGAHAADMEKRAVTHLGKMSAADDTTPLWLADQRRRAGLVRRMADHERTKR